MNFAFPLTAEEEHAIQLAKERGNKKCRRCQGGGLSSSNGRILPCPLCRRSEYDEAVRQPKGEHDVAEKLITPEAIISYPALFTPQRNEQGDEQYGCVLIFTADKNLDSLKAAALEVGREKFGAKFIDGVKAGKYTLPFRTDVADKGYPAGSTFFSVRSKYKVGVVDRFPGQDGKPVRIEGDEADKIYPGCRVRASVRPFAYDKNGKRGVSFGLLNVQKLGEGQRLDGRTAPEDEFSALSDEEIAAEGERFAFE